MQTMVVQAFPLLEASQVTDNCERVYSSFHLSSSLGAASALYCSPAIHGQKQLLHIGVLSILVVDSILLWCQTSFTNQEKERKDTCPQKPLHQAISIKKTKQTTRKAHEQPPQEAKHRGKGITFDSSSSQLAKWLRQRRQL